MALIPPLNALDELEDRADGVAVRADEDGLALLQLGSDGLLICYTVLYHSMLN